jgi:zinc/manganese transport system substrate-binding protein
MKPAVLWRGLTALVVGLASLAAQAQPMQAVASFTVIADMVRTVGGDHVAVTSLIGPNGDPHVYEPTPADAQALRSANIVFVSGLHLEGWMDRLIQASGYPNPPVVLSEGIHTRVMEEDGQPVVDPHAWNSAANAQVYVAHIITALQAVDPANAADYARNGQAYLAQLAALDTYARTQVQAVPAAQRKVLTSHDAFGYFGDAYGVTFLSPLGISTENEASAAQVAALIQQIKREHVSAYFFENSGDPRLVQQIAAASGAQPGGALYVEALSDAEGPAPTYARLFRYNVDRLVAAMRKPLGNPVTHP